MQNFICEEKKILKYHNFWRTSPADFSTAGDASPVPPLSTPMVNRVKILSLEHMGIIGPLGAPPICRWHHRAVGGTTDTGQSVSDTQPAKGHQKPPLYVRGPSRVITACQEKHQLSGGQPVYQEHDRSIGGGGGGGGTAGVSEVGTTVTPGSSLAYQGYH